MDRGRSSWPGARPGGTQGCWDGAATRRSTSTVPPRPRRWASSVACVASVRDALAAPDCASAISSVSLGGARTLVPAPDLGLRLMLPRVLQSLDRTRVEARAALGAADTAATQARWARRLASAHAGAAAALRPVASVSGAPLTEALSASARAYTRAGPNGERALGVPLPGRPARSPGERYPARRRGRRRRAAPGSDRRCSGPVAAAAGEPSLDARLAPAGPRAVGVARRRPGDPRAAPPPARSGAPALRAGRAAGAGRSAGARRTGARSAGAGAGAVGRAAHAAGWTTTLRRWRARSARASPRVVELGDRRHGLG